MPKNVLWIMSDQQGSDSRGCYGNAFAATPCLDSFAREAVRFQRAYVANPICMPNRHSLFSGRYPHNHGVYTNGLLLPDTGCSLPHYLSSLGWQTASIGKLHFTPTDGTTPPGQSPESASTWGDSCADYSFHGPYWGFQYIELTVGHSREQGHYRQWFLENGGSDAMYEGESETGDSMCLAMRLPERLHSSSFVGERTCRWLREQRDPEKPFFLVASFPDPHHPFDPPQETAERFSMERLAPPAGGPEDLETRPAHYARHFRGEWHRSGVTPKTTTPHGLGEAQARERIRNTYAMVSLIDKNVGRILDTLRELHLEEDTIVLFTSDHGELLGDHGLWLKGPFYYEGLMSVPLLLRVPGVQGRDDSGLISSVDVAPTLCGLLGLPVPYYMDGVSQEAHISDPGQQARDWCLVEYRNGFGPMDVASRAIFTQQYKYVRYQTGERELTDLREDPKETRNVASLPSYAPVCAELDNKLISAVLSSENKYPQQISFA